MKTIAILCEDRTYLERLVPAMQRALPAEYSVEGYASAEEFGKREGSRPIKAVLYTSGIGTAEEISSLRERMAGRRVPVWNLTEDPALSETEGMLFRYQPADRMVPVILRPQEAEERGTAVPETLSECRCYGVVALSGENSTAYAMALAKSQGGRTGTVVLCLSPWPESCKEWKPGENDVSELTYLLKEHGAEWYRKAVCCMRDAGPVKVIGGYTRLSDFLQITEKDADAFFEGLKAGGYGCLIVDLAGIPLPVWAERCDEIHVLGSVTGERFRSLERMLREEEMADRLRRVVSAEAAG